MRITEPAEIEGCRDDRVPEKTLGQFFDDLEDWTILKNGDLFGNLRRGGDCDITVSDESRATRQLQALLGEPAVVVKRSYVTSFFYPWGSIDFIKSYSWRGMSLIGKAGLLKSTTKTTGGDWPIVAKELEVGLWLISSLVWGGFVKPRYWPQCLEYWSNHSSRLTKVLNELVGTKASVIITKALSADDPDSLTKSLPALRRGIYATQFSRWPLRTLVGMVVFIGSEFLLTLQPPGPLRIKIVQQGCNSSQIADLKLPGFPLVSRVFHLSGRSTVTQALLVPVLLIKNARFRSKGGRLVFVFDNALARRVFKTFSCALGRTEF